MMTEQILALLIGERDKLNQAIAALSGGTVTGRRRGRPPKNRWRQRLPPPLPRSRKGGAAPLPLHSGRPRPRECARVGREEEGRGERGEEGVALFLSLSNSIWCHTG